SARCANSFGPQLRQSIVLVLGEAVDDCYVLAFNIADVLEVQAECAQTVRHRVRRSGVREPNHRHRRLLRIRRERPRRSRAAEQRDGFAPLHVWMAPAWQEIIWRAAQRSLAVMCPACWCSPGGLLALMGSANRVLIIRTGSMSR